MLPESMIFQLTQLGAAGLLVWYLWQECKRLRKMREGDRQAHLEREKQLRETIKDERQAHLEEKEQLRKRIDEQQADINARQNERAEEARDYGTVLWQISNALQAYAEIIKRPSAPSQRQPITTAEDGDAAAANE